MKKISFFKLFLQAWRTSFSRAYMLYVFGFFIALPLVVQNFFFSPLTEETDTQVLVSFLSDHALTIFFLTISFFLSSLLGKTGLIVLVNRLSRKKDSPLSPSEGSLFQAIKKCLRLELAVILFFLIVVLLLSSPLLIFFWSTQEFSPTLFLLGLLVFLPVAVVAFFIREFSFFYILLSKLSLRSALESSAALFSRHKFNSFIFVFILFFLGGIFTFFFNLVMLDITVLSEKFALTPPHKAIPIVLSLLFTLWWSVFKQAFWFFFFKEIATPDEPEKVEAGILVKESSPELPPA